MTSRRARVNSIFSCLTFATHEEAELSQDGSSTSNSGFNNRSETFRRCLLKLLVGGARLRAAVVDEAYDLGRAPALEIGIDKSELVDFCRSVEAEENVYRLLFTVALFGVVAASSAIGNDGEETLFSVGFIATLLLLSSIVSGVREIRAKLRLSTLSRRAFKYWKPDTSWIDPRYRCHCVGSLDQNVAVHRGFSPFEFAGMALGGWSFVVDLDKRAPFSSIRKDRFTTDELEERIRSAISGQFNDRVTHRDLFVVNGIDADVLPSETRFPPPPDYPSFHSVQDPNFWWDRSVRRIEVIGMPASAPKVSLTKSQGEEIAAGNPDKARRYLWFAIAFSEPELVLSYFLRFREAGHILSLEHVRHLLGPIEEVTNEPEVISPLEDGFYHRTFYSGAARGLFDLLFQPMIWLGIQLVRKRWTPYRDATTYASAQMVGIELERGAAPSLRRELMSTAFDHYFQKVDLDDAIKSLDKIVLEILASSLEECGIDVTDLRNKEMTIYNSGILVNGGDVNAEALAVGQGAAASKTSSSARSSPSGQVAR